MVPCTERQVMVLAWGAGSDSCRYFENRSDIEFNPKLLLTQRIAMPPMASDDEIWGPGGGPQNQGLRAGRRDWDFL
jgi:hypothetical protein